MSDTPRGIFVVIEGGDRCGKTTQCARLAERFNDPLALKFPDRSTDIGRTLDAYLKQSENACSPRIAHLLFSANRWEMQDQIRASLQAGRSIICDRYAFSGVVFSNKALGYDLGWCKASDEGLIAPDIVIYLDPGERDLLATRGDTGELYEKAGIQKRVREGFQDMANDYGRNHLWYNIDATDSISVIEEKIWALIKDYQPKATSTLLW